MVILMYSIVSFSQKSKQPFYAYYTHINTNETFEKSSPTGEYADIIVNLPIGKLVFWRGTSYLPKWQTSKGEWILPELVKRIGDGTATMPDRVNTFSHVSIIHSSTDSIVVHWRYLPEFKLTAYPFSHKGFDTRSFVDEYFYIYPTGNVRRLLVKGTARIDDYKSNENVASQLLTLQENGVLVGLLKLSQSNTKPLLSKFNSPINNTSDSHLITQFSFNENAGDSTLETINKSKYEVEGNKTLWKKGIKGSCLEFDGYYSTIKTKPFLPRNTDELTISTWIAIGAYPWNWVPIIQSGNKQGFFLGINAYGYPSFRVLIKDSVYEMLSKVHLETFKWYNLTATYSEKNGYMNLFINGVSTESLQIPKGMQIEFGEQGMQVGRSTAQLKPTDAVRKERTYESSFGFDGLIDEIKIYSTKRTATQIESDFQSLLSKNKVALKVDMEKRHFPIVQPSNHFRAYYTHLKYYETWDNLWRFGNYPDVVVEFANNPSKFIFWHGTSNIPMLVNDKNQWFTNEFNETWNKSGGEGCMEPMSDKENYTSHVRIIEQSPARVVVNWRVALMDVNHHVYANFDTASGWGDWMDWYYYIYPDGVAVKKMRLFTHGELNHEWQESIVLMDENRRPDDVLEKTPVFISIDTAGKETLYNWVTKPPTTVNFKDALVHKTNLKSDWDVYTITIVRDKY